MNTKDVIESHLAYAKLGNNADQYEVYEEASGRTVAVTHDDKGGRNAARFAAAPELLAALIRLLACPALGLDDLEQEDYAATEQARQAVQS